MRESVFTGELKKTLENKGLWVYKIPDMPSSILMDRLSFTPEKPCDLIVTGPKNLFVAIETKQMRKWASFGMRDLRPAQVRNLEILSMQGHHAIVALNIRIPGEKNGAIFFPYRALKLLGSIYQKDLKRLRRVPGKGGLFDFNLATLLDHDTVSIYVKSRIGKKLKIRGGRDTF